MATKTKMRQLQDQKSIQNDVQTFKLVLKEPNSQIFHNLIQVDQSKQDLTSFDPSLEGKQQANMAEVRKQSMCF